MFTLTGTLMLALALLIIFGTSSHAAGKDCFNPYAVGPTESWHSIADNCNIDYHALRDANASHIRHGDILYTGELLTLPDLPPKPESGLSTYTVAPGDSWYRIAQDNGLTFRDVRAFNPHLWKNRGEIIHPGDQFMLPLLVPVQTEEAAAVEEPVAEEAATEEAPAEETATEEAPAEEAATEEAPAEEAATEEAPAEGAATEEAPAEEAATEEAPAEEAVAEEPAPAVEMTESGCPTELTLGAPYMAGGQVQVSGDAPINLYEAEGDLSTIVGQVAPGTILQVNTDVSCIDGWLWWQVTDESQGLTGWTGADIGAIPVLDPVE
jgi:LysM repeat protein